MGNHSWGNLTESHNGKLTFLLKKKKKRGIAAIIIIVICHMKANRHQSKANVHRRCPLLNLNFHYNQSKMVCFVNLPVLQFCQSVQPACR